ncbi:MAG TPA: CoA transferase [Thermohalobaculum sp.]|nr:CoA transferase [Thermohalobaculum sp.]
MSDGDAAATGGSAPPLAGVRVLDASHVLAGPFATYQLALLGADVARVERIAGDDFVRTHGGTEAMKAAGLGASFLSQNACKRSIALDLKDARGVAVFRRLAADADVVMENFRPGVVDRLGIGFDAIRAVNDRVVYCSLSGYGPSGPLAGSPAYDHILQGICGMMAMTGTAESGPMRVGFPIVDYIAGQTAATAILAALMRRDRHGGGAQHLDVPMLDSIVSLMAAYAVDQETTGRLRGLEGNEAFSNSPFSGRFDTTDGQLVVTANTPPQARRLAAATGLPEGAADAGGDPARRAEVRRMLENAFSGASADEWEARLAEAHVPAAKVRTLAEALDHPQLRGRGLMRALAVPETGQTVHVPGLPFAQAGWRDPELTPAPTLGRDTDDLLRTAGYSEGEIEDLRASGIVA